MAEGEAAGQPDAVLLAPLSEDTFLHNLHVRYKRDIIYTYVGNALVSVNPCRALPLYSAELVRAYLARPPYQLPPHLYAITATAYRWVRDRNESQCIVITGESGAGKTEAARVCLQCAVVAGEGGGGGAGEAGGGAAGALTAAGTLLEAFGNAATARNHNASRFGKLLEIEFDFKGEPVGGHITHYLLEKERVCGVLDGERNFHVLYQLLAGADVQLLKRLRLQRAPEHYRVLRGSAPPAPGASPRRAAPPAPAAPPAAEPAAAQDRDHFAFTTAAMRALGFGPGLCDAVLRLLAFLLKLGNVEFEPQHNIDGTIGTRLQHRYELVEACALVGVDADALGEALGACAADEDAPPDAARRARRRAAARRPAARGRARGATSCSACCTRASSRGSSTPSTTTSSRPRRASAARWPSWTCTASSRWRATAWSACSSTTRPSACRPPSPAPRCAASRTSTRARAWPGARCPTPTTSCTPTCWTRAPTACWACCATARRAAAATRASCSACSGAATRACSCCRPTTSSQYTELGRCLCGVRRPQAAAPHARAFSHCGLVPAPPSHTRTQTTQIDIFSAIFYYGLAISLLLILFFIILYYSCN